ncbi:hypothetical protein AB0O28_15575 [Microbispora sp. NPDC088329]
MTTARRSRRSDGQGGSPALAAIGVGGDQVRCEAGLAALTPGLTA